jgi:hypothetical protein
MSPQKVARLPAAVKIHCGILWRGQTVSQRLRSECDLSTPARAGERERCLGMQGCRALHTVVLTSFEPCRVEIRHPAGAALRRASPPLAACSAGRRSIPYPAT